MIALTEKQFGWLAKKAADHNVTRQFPRAIYRAVVQHHNPERNKERAAVKAVGFRQFKRAGMAIRRLRRDWIRGGQ